MKIKSLRYLLVCLFLSTLALGADRRVDILIVYTPSARAYAGGTDGMRAAINSYVATTNLCYANSEIPVVLKLVGTSEISYTESGDMTTDLGRLRETADGYLDAVHSLRNSFGADLVCLIRRGAAGNVAGIAYLGNGTSGFASSAFSVVSDVWATGNLTFPHELGHNFGCHHDRDNASGSPAQPYAYGHRFTGNNSQLYISIMAYNPGTRIPYFSNPDITYQGVATGVGSGPTAADNALMHEVTSATTSSFRNVAELSGSRVRGDMDGDRAPDLVFHNQGTYQAVAWLMSGVHNSGAVLLGTAAANWNLATVGDLNGDGHSDLVWENTSDGARAVWYMRGTRRIGGAALLSAATDWRIVGSGDFNRDGYDDLVWENANAGTWALWYMRGSNRIGGTLLVSAAANWDLAAVGDLNNNGSPDLVWENTSDGSRAVWYMSNSSRTGGALLPSAATDWRIVGTGDSNGDGKTDIFFENTSDGSRVVWYMNGSSRIGGALLSSVSADWEISNN